MKSAINAVSAILCLAFLSCGQAIGQQSALGTIAGTIRDRDNGVPMKGMITFPGREIPGLVSDSIGQYRVDLEPGEYKVHIYANGYRWIERKLTVNSGQTEKWDLTLKRREAEISGSITDSIRSRPIKAAISITGSQALQAESQATDGQFRVTVKPGNYQLVVSAPGYLATNRSLSLKDKQQQKLEIRMAPNGWQTSGRFRIFAGGGAIKTMGGVLSESNYGYIAMVGGGMDLGRNITLGLRLSLGGNKLRESVWEANYQLYQNSYLMVETEGRYRLLPGDKFSPYLLASAGVLSWKNNYNGAPYIDPATGEEQKALSPIFRGGAGIEYSIAPKISLWGQGQGGMFMSGDMITTGSQIKDNLLAEGSFGVGYRF